jgi:hypothetical protein
MCIAQECNQPHRGKPCGQRSESKRKKGRAGQYEQTCFSGGLSCQAQYNKNRCGDAKHHQIQPRQSTKGGGNTSAASPAELHWKDVASRRYNGTQRRNFRGPPVRCQHGKQAFDRVEREHQ